MDEALLNSFRIFFRKRHIWSTFLTTITASVIIFKQECRTTSWGKGKCCWTSAPDVYRRTSQRVGSSQCVATGQPSPTAVERGRWTSLLGRRRFVPLPFLIHRNIWATVLTESIRIYRYITYIIFIVHRNLFISGHSGIKVNTFFDWYINVFYSWRLMNWQTTERAKRLILGRDWIKFHSHLVGIGVQVFANYRWPEPWASGAGTCLRCTF